LNGGSRCWYRMRSNSAATLSLIFDATKRLATRGHSGHRTEKKRIADPTKRLQSSQANSGCMLSGARRVHPVIVGWSTANRPPHCPSPSMIPLPHGLGQLPGERVVLDVAARAPDGGTGLNHYASLIGTTQGRPAHDQWAKSSLIWDTISHYSRVLIAPLAIISSRRHVQKKIELALGRALKDWGKGRWR